jgi:hypothetical protein
MENSGVEGFVVYLGNYGACPVIESHTGMVHMLIHIAIRII